MPDDPEVPINATIPASLRTRVKGRAALRGKTMRDYIREVLEEAVTRHEAEDRRRGRG